MNAPKQSRRKTGAQKLEPIDWHEFANDAVLNGNMSTLYHRPPSEDSTAYASQEALVEIEKRVGRPIASTVVVDSEESFSAAKPTVGIKPTVGHNPTDGAEPTVGPKLVAPSPVPGRGLILNSAGGSIPTVGIEPPAQPEGDNNLYNRPPKPPDASMPAASIGVVPAPVPTVGVKPSVGLTPTVGMNGQRKIKPIRDVQDVLTLAGQVLYKAMYGTPDGARAKSCTKGYRQLAAETHLDKDTVRDLISEFKDKGIVRETGTYDPDTRSSKTYEILSYKAILQIWRDAGLRFVTAGRQRPVFCNPQGEPLYFRPTVGIEPTGLTAQRPTVGSRPTDDLRAADPMPTPSPLSEDLAIAPTGELIQALYQITGTPVDQEAVDRLIRSCRVEASDCRIEEILEIAWSKAFLFRSGKIENPIGFLITQIPKHFQGEALRAYREKKSKALEAVAALGARDEERRREYEREAAEVEARQRIRVQIAERYRSEQGIELKAVLQDAEADEVLTEWASRMIKLGYRFQPRYD